MREQDVDALRIVIERWLRDYPELADDIQLRADMLDAETPVADVLTDLLRIDSATRMLRDGTKDQLAHLKARAERFDKRIEFAREMMISILNAADLRRFELPEATVFLRNNPQQLVGEIDAAKLPDDLVRVERKPDRAKIKDALKAGRVIEGMQLSNAAPSIVVTVK